MAQIITNIVQGVGGGIGFVSEAYKAHKATKAQKQADITSHELKPSPADTITTHDIDKEARALDEADSALRTDQETREPDQATDPLALAEALLSRLHSSTTPRTPSPPSPAFSPLPYPIIIPQRRPTTRDRGFLPCYPPILATRSISQSSFLDFLNTFNASTRATKWIAALNLASLATVCLPTLTSVLVSMAITAATTAAMEIQGRVKTNSFLDKINAEFFMPRGLFCLVVTWNPEAGDARTAVDFETLAKKAMANTGKNPMTKLKKSNASTHGEFEWPEIAPLVYPTPDELAATQAAAKKAEQTSSLQKKKVFVEDYMDRRAQAKFVSFCVCKNRQKLHKTDRISNQAMENPDSALAAGPKAKFTSRFADPSHAANSGSLVALISGGAIQMPERKDLLTYRGGRGRDGRLGGRAAFGRGFGRGEASGGAESGMQRGLGGMSGARGGNHAGPLGLVQKAMKKVCCRMAYATRIGLTRHRMFSTSLSLTCHLTMNWLQRKRLQRSCWLVKQGINLFLCSRCSRYKINIVLALSPTVHS